MLSPMEISHLFLVVHCIYVAHLLYPVIFEEHFGCFHVLATGDNAATNIGGAHSFANNFRLGF